MVEHALFFCLLHNHIAQKPCIKKIEKKIALSPTLVEVRLLSQLVTARCKAALLCDHGKGRKDRHQLNILYECPLTSLPRAGSSDGFKFKHSGSHRGVFWRPSKCLNSKTRTIQVVWH